MDTELLNIRIPVEDMGELTKLAYSVELSPRTLGRFLIKAAIRAVKANPKRFTLPVDFQIVEEPPVPASHLALNERPAPKRK